MRKTIATIATVLFSVFVSTAAFAAEHGTADEAVAMVKKAVAFMKANGKDKALAEFSNQNGQFRDRDLYIFVQDMKGKMLAHGGNDKLIGKDLIDLKDADNNYFVKTLIEVASTKGKGWIDYKWSNPSTKVIEPKSSYIERVDDVFVGCGIYKK